MAASSASLLGPPVRQIGAERIAVASALEQLAMHVNGPLRAGLFVQVVHILRAKEQAVF